MKEMIVKQTRGDECLRREREEPGEGELPLLLLPACAACIVEEEEFPCLHWHCNVSEDSCTSPAEDSILKAGYRLTCCCLRQIQIIISEGDDSVTAGLIFSLLLSP